MRTLNAIAAVAALWAGCAYGQPGPEAAPAKPQSPAVPAPVARPPALPQLAPLGEDFQAAMANSQLQTYRYGQLAEQALALKKLCETGFGPADICPNANNPVGPRADGGASANPFGLPTVAEINGTGSALSAVLILPDGRHATVRAGSLLPNGLQVSEITLDDVRVTAGGGHEQTLYFGGGTPLK